MLSSFYLGFVRNCEAFVFRVVMGWGSFAERL